MAGRPGAPRAGPAAVRPPRSSDTRGDRFASSTRIRPSHDGARAQSRRSPGAHARGGGAAGQRAGAEEGGAAVRAVAAGAPGRRAAHQLEARVADLQSGLWHRKAGGRPTEAARVRHPEPRRGHLREEASQVKSGRRVRSSLHLPRPGQAFQ